jgi:hypothetical protein
VIAVILPTQEKYMKRSKKIPSTFAFWTTSMQIAWLEQNGYSQIAADLRGE